MRGSFYGWYMKCQSDTQTLAVIPAIHLSGAKSTCSIQIISDRRLRTFFFETLCVDAVLFSGRRSFWNFPGILLKHRKEGIWLGLFMRAHLHLER